MSSTEKLMIDVPMGWMYGFPKELPIKVFNEGNIIEWLVENGYPKLQIVNLGEHFNFRIIGDLQNI